jgi:hypothetical protein
MNIKSQELRSALNEVEQKVAELRFEERDEINAESKSKEESSVSKENVETTKVIPNIEQSLTIDSPDMNE